MPAKHKPVPPESLLVKLSPELREVADRLRALIRDLVPDVIETGQSGWGLINYRHGKHFGYIGERHGDLHLGFEHGATLPDPDGILEGDGKQVRYIKIQTADDFATRLNAITELIEIAASRAKIG